MTSPRSIPSAGQVFVLLLALLLGSALGPTIGSADVTGPPTPITLGGVDLTRHTNVIVPGVEGSRGSLDVSCPLGTVIGGGFSAGRNLRIVESRPHGIRSWRVSWMQTAADDTVAYAYAVCLTSHQV
jgi:hypothetical protein